MGLTTSEKKLKIEVGELSLKADPHRAKIIAFAISEYLTKYTMDDSALTDFVFSIESSYQAYHGLDENDFDFAE